MKKNMGSADSIIRLIIAAIIAILFYSNIISGTLGVVLLVLAGVFVLTAIFKFCPIYTIVGLNTCSKEENK